MAGLASIVVSSLLLGTYASAPRPNDAVNLTLYHVNPAKFPPSPTNMNTGDALGDMFFDLRSLVLPLECAADPSQHDCTNAEVVSPDLVITKIIVEADHRFTDYAKCNICVNGTDGHGHNNCTDGEYICGCFNGLKSVPCKPGVGMENLTQTHGNESCSSGQEQWQCWRDAAGRKTGGTWFSTLDIGLCGGSKAEACTWRLAQVAKRINKTCSDNTIYSAAEDYDAEHGTGCFKKCPTPALSLPRNTSDPCWIQCFYETALGPEAGKPGGKTEGMPLQTLLDAWNAPFESEDPHTGGCPHIPDERDLEYPADIAGLVVV